MTRTAVILYNAVEANASAAEADVLVQVAVVREALESLGWEVRELPATLDLAAVERDLTIKRPDLVFNLVESLGGRDRLASLAVELLEVLGIPFTGCSSAALRLSNDKIATKKLLVASGLPTPPWFPGDDRATNFSGEWIIKPVHEHASLGMDDASVVRASSLSELVTHLRERVSKSDVEHFAESFISGREFNLSLIEREDQIMVLPPAEIVFAGYPADKPRIVGHAAKWDETSFEYLHTPRRFDFLAGDLTLLEQLSILAKDCWRVCELRGYARVDFRVDENGQPWILEINANPCLSPDGGFAAALERAGLSLLDLILQYEANQDWQDFIPNGGLPPRKHLPPADCKLRTQVFQEDVKHVRRIIASTNMFRPTEIDVAVELVETRLTRGSKSGYEFVFVEYEGKTVGYVCYGRNTLTVSSFDLYWIAVEQEQRGQGLGSVLLEEVEQRVTADGGTRLYIETSHRPDYEPTRRFYERHGYMLQALLPDFYAPGDGRAIFVKQCG